MIESESLDQAQAEGRERSTRESCGLGGRESLGTGAQGDVLAGTPWQWGRASLRLAFAVAWLAKNLPLVGLPQKQPEFSALGRGGSSCLPGGGERAFL